MSSKVCRFKTLYDAHERHTFCSNSGEKTRPNYKPKYNDNGSYELVEDGVFHSYDDIQAWLPSTDMTTIYNQYLRTGDASLLQRRASFYADVTQLPKNYAELSNMLHDADNVFNSLPLELREKFDNNPAVFYRDGNDANAIISEYIRLNSKSALDSHSPVSQSPVNSSVPDVDGGVKNE